VGGSESVVERELELVTLDGRLHYRTEDCRTTNIGASLPWVTITVSIGASKQLASS
jgi:hypothetical protein